MIGNIFRIIYNFFFAFLKVSDNDVYPPPLSAEEERKCFEKMRSGDNLAREKLIRHNMRLVAHIVKKYYTLSKNHDDLISIGTIGLIKAIDSFKPETGTRFATYAGKCLQNEILMYFRSQKKLQNEVSINEVLDTDKEGNPLTYIDIISIPDTIADDINRKAQIENVFSAVKKELTDREKKIIILRYGLSGNKPKTQREVSELLGISRSYVSRIEKAALAKIRKRMKEKGFYS